MRIPRVDPRMNGHPMNVKQFGDMGRAVLVDTEHDALYSEGDAWGFIRVGLSAQGFETSDGSSISFGEKCRQHNASPFDALLTRVLCRGKNRLSGVKFNLFR